MSTEVMAEHTNVVEFPTAYARICFMIPGRSLRHRFLPSLHSFS